MNARAKHSQEPRVLTVPELPKKLPELLELPELPEPTELPKLLKSIPGISGFFVTKLQLKISELKDPPL